MPSNVQKSCCDGPTALIACGGGAVVAIPIVLLVLGILGVQGQVAMAPIGARVMIGLGTGFILGIISGVVKCCCRT